MLKELGFSPREIAGREPKRRPRRAMPPVSPEERTRLNNMELGVEPKEPQSPRVPAVEPPATPTITSQDSPKIVVMNTGARPTEVIDEAELKASEQSAAEVPQQTGWLARLRKALS